MHPGSQELEQLTAEIAPALLELPGRAAVEQKQLTRLDGARVISSITAT